MSTAEESVWDYPPKRIPRPPSPDLAPNPDGHDPNERQPWGSRTFQGEGGTLFKGHAVLQYFFDADRHDVRTVDGYRVANLLDEQGQEVLGEEDGEPILVAVDDTGRPVKDVVG